MRGSGPNNTPTGKDFSQTIEQLRDEVSSKGDNYKSQYITNAIIDAFQESREFGGDIRKIKDDEFLDEHHIEIFQYLEKVLEDIEGNTFEIEHVNSILSESFITID